jgi:hypothetical protein
MSTHHTTRTMTAVPAPALAPVAHVHERYADLTDLRLAVTLSAEDAAEEGDLDPLERTTCYTHRRWLHHCVASPLHVIVVTGHRWCRTCSCAVNVAIDQLTGDVSLTCPKCDRMPPGAANRQLIRCCRASLAAAAESRATDLDDPWTIQSLRRNPSRRSAA